MPVNPVDAAHPVSFVRMALSEAVDQGIGVLAMKTLAGGQFFSTKYELEKKMWETNDPVIPGRFALNEALNFVWTLPVSVLISGNSTPAMIREKTQMAKNFRKMDEEYRSRLIEKVTDISEKEEVEYYRNRG
jgi:predicted aldo/keto reductase-like oxidoreductase